LTLSRQRVKLDVVAVGGRRGQSADGAVTRRHQLIGLSVFNVVVVVVDVVRRRAAAAAAAAQTGTGRRAAGRRLLSQTAVETAVKSSYTRHGTAR